ncbi:hypothetical protein SEA_GUDMIT_44 [Gordonia phage Gudmit]|nr:hypothetical protein SEA_GUDMIT_44 [Gordonia phage Gudmit]
MTKQAQARVTDRQILEARQVMARFNNGIVVPDTELAKHLARMIAAVEEGRR